MTGDAAGAQAGVFKSAFVALVGRPNSGKSTLVNTVLGEPISIVTSLPQTTRTILRGIYTDNNLQLIFLDTPGIHRGKHALNKSMYARSTGVLADGGADVICHIVDLSRELGDEEDAIASLTADIPSPVCIVFNKIDLCADAGARRATFFSRYPRLASRPRISISAIDPSAKKTLLDMLLPLIGPGPRYFPGDDLTDADMRFIAAEFIRRRIIESTREEVPHAVCVEISAYRELADRHEIEAVIHVETDGQKGIVIGARGTLINKIRRQARGDIAALCGAPVSLTCHVRVTPHWRDNPRFLAQMGLLDAGE